MAEDKKKKYEKKGISFGKDGKPTKSSMKKAYEDDKELFLDLQNDYFNTRGTMGDFNLRKFLGDKFKGDKESKKETTDKTKSKIKKGSNITNRSKFAEGYQHGVTVGNTYTNPVSKAIEKFGAKNFYGKIPFKQDKKRNAGYDKGVADGEAAQKYKKKKEEKK